MTAVPRFERLVGPALLAFCAAVAVLRYLVLTDHAPAPASVDGGNWLAFGRDLLGRDVRSSTIVYPPIIPVAVTAAVSVLGAAKGIAAVAAITSLAPGLGTYFALRGRTAPTMAAFLAALLTVAASTGEAAAWGGYPQLLGFGLAMVFLRHLEDALAEPTTTRWAWTGVSFAALLGTTHLIAAAAAAAGVVLAVLHRLSGRGSPRPRFLLRDVAALLGPSLLFAPVYVRLLDEIVGGYGDRPSFARLDLTDAPEILNHMYRDFPALWFPLLVLAALTPIALIDQWRHPLWRLLLALVVTSIAATVILRESRFLYLTILPAAVAAGLWAVVLRARISGVASRVAIGAALLVVGMAASSGLSLFDDQFRFYAEVDRGMYDAIEWIRRETPRAARIAVANSSDLPVGWWVEGLARRPSLVGTPLRWLSFEDEQRRARLANDIFSETFPDEAAFALAGRVGVDYLLVPARWAGGPRDRVRAYALQHPNRVVLKNASAVVFRV